MPPMNPSTRERSLDEVVDALGLYPIDAFYFVQRGLSFTVERLHGKLTDPRQGRHISGPELCQGLRELALAQWGMMARTVLERWKITSTLDFGRIVFTLVENGFLQKTDEDELADFRNVYDFRTAFDSTYRIPCRV
jgi:uncharacterized repeat protein (TIGR04138 family)